MTNQTPVRSPVEGLRAGTDAMMSLDPCEFSDGELASTILRFKVELDRLDSVFADLVVAGHRRGIGREDGYESTPSWLRARAGLLRVRCMARSRRVNSGRSSPRRVMPGGRDASLRVRSA